MTVATPQGAVVFAVIVEFSKRDVCWVRGAKIKNNLVSNSSFESVTRYLTKCWEFDQIQS